MQRINFKSEILPKTPKQQALYEHQKYQPAAVFVELHKGDNRERKRAGGAPSRGPANRVTMRKLHRVIAPRLAAKAA